MARRTVASARSLAKLLAESAGPIYALDERRRIVYCNEACERWLEVDAGSLLGVACDYHSRPQSDRANADGANGDRANEAACRICPPPAVLSGEQGDAVWTIAINVDGKTCRRKARAATLVDGSGQPVGVLAVVDAADRQDDGNTDPTTSNAAALHERIARFHAEHRSRRSLDRLIGDWPAMRLARARLATALGNRASVLLVGAEGTGRRFAAESIHYGDPNAADTTLAPLDCALLGADLLKTTLGALETRIDSPRTDHCGAIYLADVDQSERDVQFVLAEYLLRPNRRVRAIASSRRPLLELASEGMFRADLAAELSTIVVALPSLAERIADLPLVAQAMLEELNAESKKQLGGFSDSALERMARYDWPGNLDELFDAVRAAHQQAATSRVERDDLPKKLAYAADAADHPRRAIEPASLDAALVELERSLIEQALRQAKGNKAQAARLLEINRPRLLRRMEQLGFGADDE